MTYGTTTYCERPVIFFFHRPPLGASHLALRPTQLALGPSQLALRPFQLAPRLTRLNPRPSQRCSLLRGLPNGIQGPPSWLVRPSQLSSGQDQLLMPCQGVPCLLRSAFALVLILLFKGPQILAFSKCYTEIKIILILR